MLIYIIAALLSGVSIVISRIINSQLGNKIGVFQSTFYNYLTGLFLSGVFLLVSKETLLASTDTLRAIPFAAYLGGLVGVISIAFSNYVAPKISAFYMADNNGLQGVLFRYSSKIHTKYIKMRKNQI